MEQPNKPIWIHALSWCSLGAYLLSFGLPTITGGVDSISGGWAFVLCFWFSTSPRIHGQNGNFLVPLLAWAANPLFWCGAVLLYRGKWRGAAILGLAATVFASAFALQAWFEPPRKTPEGNLLVGYYVWWSSMGLLAATGLAGACAALRNQRRS